MRKTVVVLCMALLIVFGIAACSSKDKDNGGGASKVNEIVAAYKDAGFTDTLDATTQQLWNAVKSAYTSLGITDVACVMNTNLANYEIIYIFYGSASGIASVKEVYDDSDTAVKQNGQHLAASIVVSGTANFAPFDTALAA